jgi:hypothetical protein
MPKLVKIGLYVLIFGIGQNNILGQSYPKHDIDLQNFVRQVIGIPTGDLNYDDLMENLAQLYYQPLDLNLASREQLANLYLLTDSQVNKLIQHRSYVGQLLSIYELQVVEGYDLATIYKILPFVTVKNTGLSTGAIAQSLQGASQYLILRSTNTLEQKKGYTPLQGRETVRYLGTPGNLYLRYKLFHAKDISMGITLEKDDGEALGFDAPKRKYLADYNSFHFELKNKGHWQSIHLGDYQMQFGQGLVLSAGFYLGKGSETILGTRRNSLGVKSYTSLLEQDFFRGAAASYRLGGWHLTAFASNKRRTANYVLDKNTGLATVSSLDTDGLHRTASELADKNLLLEQSTGGNISYKNHSETLEIGLTGLHSAYSLPIVKQNRAYNNYEFSGSSNQIISFNHSALWRNFNAFGEVARSRSGGIGIVQGAIVTLGKRSDISAVYRMYQRHFHSFYANAFGENSRNINETGYYLGYKFAPSRWWTYTSSVDLFKFPYMKFGVDGPSQGLEFLHRLSHKPTKTTDWYLQYREQHKPYNAKERAKRLLDNHIRRNIALHYEKEIDSRWTISSTMQASNYKIQDQKASFGFAYIQNARLNLQKIKLDARIAYFNTQNYDNRQYAYEQDVQYGFSFPAYYGHGLRHYAMATIKAIKDVNLQIRWARTNLFAVESTGSGLDLINKPHKTDLRMQVMWAF